MTSTGVRIWNEGRRDRRREPRRRIEDSVIILFIASTTCEYKSAGVISYRNIRAAASHTFASIWRGCFEIVMMCYVNGSFISRLLDS